MKKHLVLVLLVVGSNATLADSGATRANAALGSIKPDEGFSAETTPPAFERRRGSHNAETLSKFFGAYDSVRYLNGDLVVSGSGNIVAFASGSGTWGATTHIRIVQLQGEHSDSMVVGEGFSPALSNDETQLAYLSRESGATQVWLFDFKNKQRRQLSKIPGGIVSPSPGVETRDYYGLFRIEWAADDKRIAFALAHQKKLDITTKNEASWLKPTTARENVKVHIFDKGASPLAPIEAGLTNGFGNRGAMGGIGESSRIMTLDVETGIATVINTPSSSLLSPRWVPSSRSKIVASKRTYSGQGVDARVHTRLVLIDALSGAMKELTHTNGTDECPNVSPDGRFVAFLRNDSDGRTQPLAQRRLIVLDLNTAQEHDLNIDLPIHGMTWISRNDLTILARDQLDSVLITISASTQKTGQVSRHHSRISSIGSSELGARYTWIEADPRTSLRVVRQSSNEKRILFQEADPFERLGPKGEYVPLDWRDTDGEQVTAMLIMPKDSKGPIPLIVNPYPESAGWGFDGNRVNGTQILLSQGYAVLKVNVRTPHTWLYFVSTERQGLPGRGVPGLKTLVSDINNAIVAATSKRAIDPRRICGFGHSNGGGALIQYMTAESRLKCAVVAAAAGVGWWEDGGQSPFYTASIAGGPYLWQKPDIYVSLDPLSRIDRITTPVLFAVGKDDLTFPVDTVNLFNALRYAGGDAALLIYPDQGHVFTGSAEMDFWTRELEFLQFHTAGN